MPGNKAASDAELEATSLREILEPLDLARVAAIYLHVEEQGHVHVSAKTMAGLAESLGTTAQGIEDILNLMIERGYFRVGYRAGAVMIVAVSSKADNEASIDNVTTH